MRSSSPAVRRAALIGAPLVVGVGLLAGFALRIHKAPEPVPSATPSASSPDTPRESPEREIEKSEHARESEHARIKAMRDFALANAPAGEVVTSDVDEPVALVLDDERAYWADARRGVVASMERGGKRPRVLAERLFFSKTGGVLAADAEHLYWTSGGRAKGDEIVHGVFAVAKSGGAAEQIAAARGGAGDLAVAGETLYWFDREGEAKSAEATLLAISIAFEASASNRKTKQVRPIRQIAKLGPACALAADEAHLYWLELGERPALKRSDLEGGGIVTLAPANGAACALAVDAHAISWVRPKLDQVLTLDKESHVASVLASTPTRPSAIVASKGGLFVATDLFPESERFESVVYRVEKGVDAMPIAHAGKLSSLAARGTTVAWSSYDDAGGAIRRIEASEPPASAK